MGLWEVWAFKEGELKYSKIQREKNAKGRVKWTGRWAWRVEDGRWRLVSIIKDLLEQSPPKIAIDTS